MANKKNNEPLEEKEYLSDDELELIHSKYKTFYDACDIVIREIQLTGEKVTERSVNSRICRLINRKAKNAPSPLALP